MDIFIKNIKESGIGALPNLEYDFGQALNFTANTLQYGLVTNINGVAFPTDISVVVWYRLNRFLIAFGGAPLFVTFFETCENTATKNLFNIGIDTVSFIAPTLRLVMNDNASALIGAVGGNDVNSMAPVDFAIHCFVATVEQSGSNTIMKYYLDGAFKNSSTIATTSRPASFFTNTYIGRNRATGKISPITIGEHRVLPQALTAQQIKDNWNEGKGNANLDALTHLMWYNFEGNSNDLSGNSRNLTLSGSPTYTTF